MSLAQPPSSFSLVAKFGEVISVGLPIPGFSSFSDAIAADRVSALRWNSPRQDSFGLEGAIERPDPLEAGVGEPAMMPGTLCAVGVGDGRSRSHY